MNRKSPYFNEIERTLARIGRAGFDPNAVECWMRLEHSTLDALTRAKFDLEVEIACLCIEADPDGTHDLLVSYGLA